MTKENTVVEIERILKETKSYIDTHNHHRREMKAGEDFAGYMVVETIESGDIDICPMFKNHFCVNPFYVEDGEVLLDPCSIGGLLDMRNFTPAQAIEEYNKLHAKGNTNFALEQQILRFVEL